MAWLIRWGCDDAFISFTYSRSLVRGDGLTWFGDHVEGYTNFAWVLWIAAGLKIGVAPLVWAWIGSLSAMVGAFIFTYRFARAAQVAQIVGLCACAIIATNFTFIAFGTSGLETMLQCCIVTYVLAHAEYVRRGRELPTRRAFLISIAIGMALWTRLDSVVAVAPAALVIVVCALRDRRYKQLTALLAPATALVGSWMVWKLSYYGDVFPNTFYAKVGLSTATIAAAARFAGAFLQSYLLWPFLVLAALLAIVRRRVPMPLAVATVVLWYAYVIVVGGDFMEFRFFVPTLPALALIIADAVENVPARISPRLRAAAAVAILACASWRHAATFEGVSDRFYDSIQTLATYYGEVDDNEWSTLGSPLHALADTGATLACNGAGAIPYYADLRTIDQLGLNDRWVARHGARPPTRFLRPGHQRFATYEYLTAQRVTFVIGRPTVVARGALSHNSLSPVFQQWLNTVLGFPPPGNQIVVVAAPVSDTRALLLWYLTPSPEVNRRIQSLGWEYRQVRW